MHDFTRRIGRALLPGAFVFSLLLAPGCPLRAADPEDVVMKDAFEKGTLAQGQQSLEAALAGNPTPDGAQMNQRHYALGIVQFLRSVEKLGQSWRRYGLRVTGPASQLPFLRLPVGETSHAATPVSYEDVRTVYTTFLADLKTAEATFAALPADPDKVPVRFGLVHLDYAGDGKPDDTETLWRTYNRLNHDTEITEQNASDFLIKFDAGDVPWFRGYCHLLSAFVETLLAYDESRLFDHTAHLFFQYPKSPFGFLVAGAGHSPTDFDFDSITDYIAFVHLMNFPVREPARLAAALDHLTRVPELSRESWRRIQAETDDDHEWIPNPHQTGALPNVHVSQEMIDAWHKTLDEADAILAGRKLLPFWRKGVGVGKGVNLHRFFTEPKDFDLVLWVQGPGAAPYLEEGTLTDPKLWQEFNSAFGAEALGFALYFN